MAHLFSFWSGLMVMLLMLMPTNQYQQVMRHDIAEIWLTWAFPLAFVPWDSLSRTNTLSQPLRFFWNALGWRINYVRFRSSELLCADLKVYRNSKWSKGLLLTTVTLESRDVDKGMHDEIGGHNNNNNSNLSNSDYYYIIAVNYTLIM